MERRSAPTSLLCLPDEALLQVLAHVGTSLVFADGHHCDLITATQVRRGP